MESKMVKFLFKMGADPHIEDINGIDCCDKLKNNKRYDKYHKLLQIDCKINPNVRKKFDEKTFAAKSMQKLFKRGIKNKYNELQNISIKN